MIISMVKRILCILVAFCTVFTPIAALAANSYTMGYSIGDSTYQLESKYCVELRSAEILGDGISFSSGGYAVYDFYLPFNSRSVTVKYKYNSNATVMIDTGVFEYSLSLKEASGEETLVFGEYLGIEPFEFTYVSATSHVCEKEFVERQGERIFKITATGAVTITDIEFEKELTPVPTNTPAGLPTFESINLSANERAVETAVIIDRNSSIIMVNGARRYINIDNPKETPFEMNGRLYLPIDTLARALGYYYENLPDKNYALLRQEPYEFVFLGGRCMLYKNFALPQEVEIPLIYRDGRAFLPVRYFAEVLGETVGYKDGIVAIDNKFAVKDILNNITVFNYVEEKLAEFYPSSGTENTYYVAQTANASDDSSGTIFAPFRTLAKAGQVAKAGDTVIIREGIYREVLSPRNDGTPTNPITFKAAEGERVVISANEEVTQFMYYKDNIYTANMPWDLGDGRNQIFINEEPLTEARYPNGPSLHIDEGSPKLSNMWPIRGEMSVSVENNKIVESDMLLDQPANHWVGGTYVGLFGYGWAISTAKIESSEPGFLNVIDEGQTWWFDPKQHNAQNFGYITGHINCLDEPGEWVISDGTLYIIFPEDVDSENVTVEAKRRQLVADIADRKYVRLEGITTIGGSIRMNNSEMCALDGLDMNYISHYTFSMDQRNGFIDRPLDKANPNGAPPRGEVGIYIGGKDNIIVNNRINHSAAAGLFVTNAYAYIENNALNDCGYMGSYVSGITLDTVPWQAFDAVRGGHGIFNNTVYNSGRSVFNVNGNHGTGGYRVQPYLPYEVAYNDFHDGMLCSLDTGMTYEFYINGGSDKQKSMMHHNLAYYTIGEKDTNPDTYGIYHDGGSQGIDTYNNLIFKTHKGAMFTAKPVYRQPLPAAVGNHNIWNNLHLGHVEGGISGLEEKHYPNGKPFYAGAWHDSGEYLENYERFANNVELPMYLARDAELSEGVVIDEYGYAVFSGNDQYIRFKDVDFGEASNIFALYFAGDKYYTGDAIDVIVGDLETGKEYSFTLNAESPYLNHNNYFRRPIALTSGVRDVYIRVKDHKTAKIGGIMIDNHEIDHTMAAKIYAGTFDSFTKTHSNYDPSPRYMSIDPMNPYLANTWCGTTLEYRKITLTDDSDTLVMEIASSTLVGTVYSGQPVEIRVGSPQGELLVKYYVPERESFGDYKLEEFKLDRVLPAGMYDFYVVFPIEEGISPNKTSNFYYFGFKKMNQ
jgi:hypothetical protein